MGSLAFVGQSRIAWAITRCQTNQKRRLMTCIKNNLADDTTGLAYTIEPYGADGGAVLAWESEPVTMEPDDAMATTRRKPGPKPSEREDAVTWLHRELLDGEKLAGDVLNAAHQAGHSGSTIRRAFDELECKRKKAGFNEGWL